MRNKRSWTAVIAAGMLLLSLCACDSGNGKTATEKSVSPSETSVSSEAPVNDALTVDSALKEGQTVMFGRYEQDGNLENGAEPIEWRVLSVKDDRAMLIAEKILDCKPFHETGWVSVDWETCTLRTWLNEDFCQAAFSEEEQVKLLDTSHDGSTDKVFLLSYKQAKSLFASKAKRKGFPTAYALQQGLLENENGTGMWWIASYNHHPYRVDYISRGGGINEYGARAHDNWVGVRPSVRVKWKVSPEA